MQLVGRHQRARQNRPGHGVGGNALERIFRSLPRTDLRCPHALARAGAVAQARKRDAQGSGNHHVHQNRDDSRARRLRPQQRHQERHAHKAGVRKGAHQGAKGRVVPANATAPRHAHHQRHHYQRTKQVSQGHAGVEQLGNWRASAKAVQHAGQRKKQHKSVHAGNGGQRQQSLARRQVATQHQGEEGKGDGQGGEHGAIVRAKPRGSGIRGHR